MTAIRSDVLILGSSLGSLVAGTFLARAGLRVVLLEEDVHAKRPPLLREPFLLTGLALGEPVDALLRDLAVPLLERREILREEVALQVLLPDARIDVGGGRQSLARELDVHGLCDEPRAREWLERSDVQGEEERERMQDALRALWSLGDRLAARRSGPRSASEALDELPGGLGRLVAAQLLVSARLHPPALGAAAALLLRAMRDGAFRMPHAGRPFLDVFRRRFLSFHGEIRSVEEFALIADRNEVGVELGRDRLYGRALLVGVPREPLCRYLEEHASAPRWLRGAPPPIEHPSYLLRAERDALPVGMASRAVCAQGDLETDAWWLVRAADADDPNVEWVALYGPGAAGQAWGPPLQAVAPFSEGRLLPVDVGPSPRWDRDGPELAFLSPRLPVTLKRRPLVVAVGPEVAPELGFEGEVVLARQLAERLAERLGAEKRGL